MTTAGCMIRGGWMILVPDASVAVKWVLTENDSETARRLLQGEHELHVPRLMAAELCNTLRSKVRSGLLDPGSAPILLNSVLNVSLNWANDEGLALDALRIAIALNRAVYDCVYLALAYQIGGTLVTVDERFVNSLTATEHRSRVSLLAEFVPA